MLISLQRRRSAAICMYIYTSCAPTDTVHSTGLHGKQGSHLFSSKFRSVSKWQCPMHPDCDCATMKCVPISITPTILSVFKWGEKFAGTSCLEQRNPALSYSHSFVRGRMLKIINCSENTKSHCTIVFRQKNLAAALIALICTRAVQTDCAVRIVRLAILGRHDFSASDFEFPSHRGTM